MNSIEPITPRPVGGGGRWQPAYTEKEAVASGFIAKSQYRPVTLWSRTVVEYHQALGTSRQDWEPTPTHAEQLVGPYIDAGDLTLQSRLSGMVDPLLDRAQVAKETAKSLIEAAEAHPNPVTTPESGTTYTAVRATDVVDEHNRKIEANLAAGENHDRRTSPALKTIGGWAPWAETVGFLAFLAYYANVPLLRPWEDLLGLSFIAVVVVGIIAGQTWLVRHAAEAHNQGREASADGNRFAADASFKKRNGFLGAVGVTAGAITAGMVLRAVAALGHVAPLTTVVMILLAVVTGAVLPALAYMAIAFDGSKRSRERDNLSADLEADLQEQADRKDEARANLELVHDTAALLSRKVFPGICTDVQGTIDAVHPAYNFGRLQVGGLAMNPPSKAAMAINRDGNGNIIGALLSTGIPDTRTVDLLPLLHRQRRLQELVNDVDVLGKRLHVIPEHPWVKSSYAPPQ